MLEGRTAVITGALGRLGRVWTAALLQAGAEVVAVDLAGEPPDGLAGAPGFTLERADVTDRAALDAIAARRRADVLVCAAGIDQPPEAGASTYLLEDFPLADFRRTVDVNLAGAFASIQAFGAPMARSGGGSIIAIGSLYGRIAPDPRLYDHMGADPPFLKPPAYGASKAGLAMLVRYVARAWGPSGVRANVLSPGGVAGGQDPEFVAKYQARVPLGRMADAADLVGPLLFLASDASRYVSGQELVVDGGLTA